MTQVLLLDAIDGIVDQDRILAERIHKEGQNYDPVVYICVCICAPLCDMYTPYEAIYTIQYSLYSTLHCEDIHLLYEPLLLYTLLLIVLFTQSYAPI